MKTTNFMLANGTVKDSAENGIKVNTTISRKKLTATIPKVKTSSFGDALDEARTGQSQIKTAEKPETAKTQPAKMKEDTAKSEDVGKDALTEKAGAVLPDHSTTQEASGKTGDKASAKTAVAESEEASKPAETSLNAMLMAMATSALEMVAPTVEATETEENLAQPLSTLPKEMPMALDALLPQNAGKTAQAAQNQQLMNLLSGSSLGVTTDTVPQNVLAENEAVLADALLTAEEPAVILPEALSATNVSLDKTAVPANAAVAQQPAVLADTAALARQTGAVKNDANPAVKNAADSLWQGVSLTIEDTIALPQENAVRTDLGDMMRQDSRESSQTPATLTEMDGKGIRQGAQLPEEAAFDTVKLAQGGGRETIAPPLTVNTFTPAVGLTNGAGTAGAVDSPATDSYEVVRQIVDQAKLIRSTDSSAEMVIRLKPEHLGELTLRVSVTAGGAVNASFHTDNPQTRGLIENSMVQLKQEFQTQGMKVDNVSVSTGLSQDFFANSQAGQQGYPQPQYSAHSQELDRAAFTGDAEAVSALGVNNAGSVVSLDPNVGTADGVDYRV